ncbi:ankyrin repeat-containing domain protein [Apodospora peruviana]|uniref:Ankyrin repeat-containing domain protein n=1 Tax=Apodospora peruviana TaxID=516989 RepID=A0AAE0IU58_9PEZI|nr:ankyrin repeat-containing domain protein [Apodospora peruviana]
MPKKIEWDKHRSELVRLYDAEGWPLKEVCDFMLSERDFRASKGSYERKLREWRVGKKARTTGNSRLRVMRPFITSQIALAPRPATSPKLAMLSTATAVSGSQGSDISVLWDMRSPWGKFLASMRFLAIRDSAEESTSENDWTVSTTAADINKLERVPDSIQALKRQSEMGSDAALRTREEMVASTVTALKKRIPEQQEGQHLTTAELANNFTFHESHASVPLMPTAQDVERHDKRVLGLIRPIVPGVLESIKEFLSAPPTTKAILEQVFASVLRMADIATLKALLDIGVNLDTVIDRPELLGSVTPLHYAAGIQDEATSLEIVHLLIKYGAPVNCLTGFEGKSTLVPALQQRHTDVAKILFQTGVRAGSRLSLLAAPWVGGVDMVRMVSGTCSHQDINPEHSGSAYYRGPLASAVWNQDLQIAKILIERGANVSATCRIPRPLKYPKRYNGANYQDYVYTKILGLTLYRGDLEMANYLLREVHADIDMPDTRSGCRNKPMAPPLRMACLGGHEDMALILLELGADAFERDSEKGAGLIGYDLNKALSDYPGRTTLLGALVRRRNGYINIRLCESLICKGARLDHALIEAALANNQKAVEYFLAQGAPMSVSPEFPTTALGAAMEEEFVGTVQVLLANGATETGALNRIRGTEMLNLLQRSKIPSRLLSARGSEILAGAIGSQDWNLTKGLLFAQNPFGSATGRTLRYGNQVGKAESDTRERIPEQLEPLDPIEYYASALVTAAKQGKCQMLRLLLDATRWGPRRVGTALTAAIVHRHTDAVQDLSSSNPSTNEDLVHKPTMEHYLSALDAAVGSRELPLTQGLISMRLRSEFGGTVLYHAASGGHIAVVKRLLAANADINARDPKYGRIALQGAAGHGRMELLDLLIKNGARYSGSLRVPYIRAVRIGASNGHNAVAEHLRSFGGFTESDDRVGFKPWDWAVLGDCSCDSDDCAKLRKTMDRTNTSYQMKRLGKNMTPLRSGFRKLMLTKENKFM